MRNINPNGRYCMYLRRSRADIDEERRGAGETLARHYKMLTELANRMGIVVASDAVYREIVSGDTLAERAEVQRLLRDVEGNMWDGVLVTEMSRLARGDTMDQGIVANTFLYSNTLIITPNRIYDLRDQSDEGIAEMDLFMARYEYRQIKRRLQAGRVNSVKQGLYVGSIDPYGYRRYKLPNQRGYSLGIVPEEAAVVRMVFDWYLNGLDGREVGCGTIADRLNSLGYRTNHGLRWADDRLISMLKNPTYCGMVWWGRRVQEVNMQDGQRVKRRVAAEPIMVEAMHEAIVSVETWKAVQQRIVSRRNSPNIAKRGVRNPFAGIMKCGVCGKAMTYCLNKKRKLEQCLVTCSRRGCKTSSSYLPVVERAVLEALQSWVDIYDGPVDVDVAAPEADAKKTQIEAIEKNLKTLNAQLSRIRDLLEQGVYTVDVYIERQNDISARIEALNDQLAHMIAPAPVSTADAIRAEIPQIKTVIELYNVAGSAEEKNKLLKSVIGRIIYHKTERNERNTGNDGAKLTLDIYPLIPK